MVKSHSNRRAQEQQQYGHYSSVVHLYFLDVDKATLFVPSFLLFNDIYFLGIYHILYSSQYGTVNPYLPLLLLAADSSSKNVVILE